MNTQGKTNRYQLESRGKPFMVAREVIEDASLSLTQKMVCVVLCSFADRQLPSYEEIARIAGCSREEAVTAVQESINRKHITIEAGGAL